MTDIVERLRTMAAECGVIDCNEAADEIERLRTDVEVYVKAASELELDAARYRWLRDSASVRTVHIGTSDGWSHYGTAADAAIDAAMKL